MLKRFAALAAAVVLVALPATAGAARPHQAKVRLLVEFAHGSTGHAQDDALRGANATVKRTIPRLHAVAVTVPKKSVAQSIARLEGSEAVASVQRDVRFRPQSRAAYTAASCSAAS